MSSNIPSRVREAIIAEAGGLCVNPNCRRQLTTNFAVYFGEAAHIRAKRPGGQRHIADWSKEELDSAENLMPLCPSCHRIIDKPEGAKQYTDDVLDGWWTLRRLEQSQRAVPQATRVQREYIDRIVEGIVSLAAEDSLNTSPDDMILVNVTRKIEINQLSEAITNEIRWALSQQQHVDEYFNVQRRFHVNIQEQARHAVVSQYNIQSTNLFNDRLFSALIHWAMQGQTEERFRQAATVLITYFFERCDIFERGDTSC